MARWPPDAQERLQDAALALFADQGYARTTVAEIAARAGLRERSFFRYFADKRDVLFPDQDGFLVVIVEAVTGAPAGVSPLDAVVVGFGAVTAWFDERRRLARARKDVIDAYPELRERELTKMAGLSAAIAQALRSRGVPEPDATLAGEAGVAAFRHASDRWIAGDDDRGLSQHIDAAVEGLRRVAGPARRPLA